MTTAVLYRWRLKPGRDADFREAWAEGTRRIHDTCGSHGAALNQDEDGIYWSYAVWPDEAVRKACFKENDWFSQDCFVTMQDCITERFEEIRLEVTNSELVPPPKPHAVPPLVTNRLVLRPLELDDAPALLPALSDPGNMQYWSSGPVETVDDVRQYLRWNVEGEGVQSWAITRTGAQDDALGWVVLMDRRAGTAEIGYMSRPDAQGSGLVREAVKRVCRYAFEERGLRRLYADTDPDNTGSIRLLEAIGFQQEGRLREAWETHIGLRDSLIFGLTRRDRMDG
jgi:ribosomal-protein-alanine N-acetyltransferase